MKIEHGTAAVICNHVFRGERPVLLVATDDGDWQFLCGGTHQSTSDYKVACLHCVLEHDPTLAELMDLPPNWTAERKSAAAAWIRCRSSEAQE